MSVDFSSRSRSNRAGVTGARSAVVCDHPDAWTPSNDETSEATLHPLASCASGLSDPQHMSLDQDQPDKENHGLDASESMAEFRELVMSAGAYGKIVLIP